MGDGWLLFRGPSRDVDLPTDFYLREMSAHAPTTDEEVVAWAQQWGRCCDPAYRDRPEGPLHIRQRIDFALRYQRAVRHSNSGGLLTIRTLLADELDVPDSRDIVHVEEIKDRLEAFTWLAGRMIEWKSGVERDADTYNIFAEQLNAALSAFQVHISIGSRSDVLPRVTAFSVAALQLLNDLASETPMRQCGNEKCPHGGVFTRQRGRSQYGQHRTAGIKYCSNLCARAQGERERRRRNNKGNK